MLSLISHYIHSMSTSQISFALYVDPSFAISFTWVLSMNTLLRVLDYFGLNFCSLNVEVQDDHKGAALVDTSLLQSAFESWALSVDFQVSNSNVPTTGEAPKHQTCRS
jgi:hypothetical protein